ncbi:hypothetical protein [Arhodomonas aquaeolei]|uniref:hypothetical protein n=1 Tax=Arhodomonas aquaeolei TaxID=2369 RepID=UPI001FE0A483|nr:hypothetical protein [Arhodomonas aquaeolei]
MQQPRTQAPGASVAVAGETMHTLRQIDEWFARPKGTAFRAFKALRREGALTEGRDFRHLDAAEHGEWIEQLRAGGDVYRATVHAVVFTTGAAQRLGGRMTDISDSG